MDISNKFDFPFVEFLVVFIAICLEDLIEIWQVVC